MRLQISLVERLVIVVAVLALSLVPRPSQAAEPAPAVWQVAERNGSDPPIFGIRNPNMVQITLSVNIANETNATIGITPIADAPPEILGGAPLIGDNSTLRPSGHARHMEHHARDGPTAAIAVDDTYLNSARHTGAAPSRRQNLRL